MIVHKHWFLFISVLLFAISVVYDYKWLSFISSIVIIFYSEYNLKIKVLTHCAGCFSSLYSRVQGYFRKYINYSTRTGVYCSTPEMQNRYTTGIFKNDSMVSPIRKNDQSGIYNGSPLNRSQDLGGGSPFNRLSRYSLSENVDRSPMSSTKLNSSFGSPQFRSRAAGVKTMQTVAGPLLASTRHRINPSLYTDVNSPGLTQRIVHYSESFQNERPTIEQRYKGVGQLPIVNLNRNQPRKPPVNKSSVRIRIAPPDVSSVTEQRLHMLNTDQHRPIVPSPIQESIASPTKSVLEALKEISRKRIHTQDDSEYSFSEDISKRQRKESLTRNNVSSTPFARPPISKRPRDDESHDFVDTSVFSRLSPNDSSYKNWRPKKKQRNEVLKCNDILSSLSSSRHLQRENHKRKAELSPRENAKHMKLTIHNVSNISIGGEDDDKDNVEASPSPNVTNVKTATIIAVSSEDTEKPKESPKVKMFNKSHNKEIISHADSSDDENDFEKMAFVKPRKEMYNHTGLNYTEECKLKQMLNCLSEKGLGDKLKLKRQETVDNPIPIPKLVNFTLEKENELVNQSSSIITNVLKPGIDNNAAKTSVSSFVPPTTTSKSNDDATPKSTISMVPPKSTTFTMPPNSTTLSPGFTLPAASKPAEKFQTVTSTSNSALNNKIQVSATSTSTLPTLTSSPTFSFGKSNPSAISSPLNQTLNSSSKDINSEKLLVSTSNSAPTILNSSIQSNKIAVSTPMFNSPTTTTPNLNKTPSLFGNLNTTASLTASTTSLNSDQLKSNFKPTILPKQDSPSINGEVKSNTGFTLPTQVKPVVSSSAPTFIFGNSTPQTTTSSQTAAPQFNFVNSTSTSKSGNNTLSGLSANKQEASVTSASTNNATFNFGSATNNGGGSGSIFGANKSTVFGAATSITTSASFNAPITTPAFGATKAAMNTTFVATTASIPVSNTPSIFGNTATTKPTFGASVTTASSTFGASVTTASSTFGASVTTASSTFGASVTTASSAFGASVTTASTFGAVAPATTTSSIFGAVASKTTASSTFGAVASVTTASTTFGISTKTSSATFGPSTTTSLSTFAIPTTTASTFGIPTTTSSVFGAAKSPISFGATATKPNATSLFGNGLPSTTSKPGGFSFGNSTTNASPLGTFGANSVTTATFGATTTAVSFGTAASPPVFGATTKASAFGGATAAPAFGTASATPTFGATTSASTFGATSATPAFGATSSTPAFGATSATSSAFGNSTAAPAFGASSATKPAFGVSSTAPIFGGASNPGFGAATPAFGSSSTTPAFGAAPAAAPPAYGATTTSAPAFGTGTATVSFGAGSTNTAFNSPSASGSMFGANNQPTTNPTDKSGVFTFGSNTNSSTPFQFGAQNTAGKGFNFNAPAVTPAFGAGTPSVAAPNFNSTIASPSPAFGVPNPGFGANPAGGTMFNIGAGGGAKPRIRARRQR
ncbi:nuclear pore complex protein DDB_G0274915 [Ctenocephalides felis]|uniref:nuclear pore complex protein DDB_G0274915 n=1 Tax=Ctenocephalides felis TaxID=7515 RepID=UPI000E6E2C20|nr:nuclear pore complex protein DDB_G0274915 [Ctenocephalides felis]